MFFHRVALLIGLVLMSCSFVSAKYEILNDVLYDNQNKQVPKDEYVKVMIYMCSSKEYNETIAEWLIHNGLEDDNEAIIWASRDGHLEVVKLLLKHDKVDPSAKNNEAIQLASNFGHSEVVKHLLKHEKVDPTANDNKAIQLAIVFGHVDVFKLLLQDKRVKKALKDEFIIDLASQSKHFESLKLLLKEGKVDEKLDENYVKAYHSENGHNELVKLLLKDESVDLAMDNNEAIVGASKIGYVDFVELLLKDGRVDPSANDNQAIRLASQFGHSEVVKLLLKHEKVDPSADDNHAIIWASHNGHAAVVELLLTNSSVDASKALEIAIEEKYYGIVSIINKARPKLFINETVSIDKNVLNEAKKTIQVKTTISVENSKLIVNYESLKDYEAIFELSSMNDDSTIYLNVFDISYGKLSIEMNKLRNSNYWNWRWICAKQTIENNGKFQISPTSIIMKDNFIYWNNSNLIGFDLPAKITYNSLVLDEIDSIMDKNNVTLDLDKMTVIEKKEFDLLFECWGTKIIISTKINSKVGDISNFLDSNNSTIPDVSIGSKLPIWIIVVIVISTVVIIAIAITVYLCIRSRRRQRNLARLRAFGNGKLHIFHIGPVETIGKQRRR